MAGKVDLLRSLRIERSSEDAETEQDGGGGRPGIFLLGGVAAGALLVGGIIGWVAKPAPPPPPPAPVEEAAVSGAPARGGLVASGYVVARRAATVAAEVTGRVIEIRVEEGQAVKAGDILAVLEPTLARAEADSASARARASGAELAEARRVLERSQALADRGFASTASLTAAQARVDTAVAQERASRSEAARASAQLARYQIRAPFDGVITNKAAQPGEIISPMSAGGGFTRTGICTIVDMTSLEVEVDVNEAFIASVREGQRVEAVLDAYPGVTFPAHVIAIIPSANRERATFRVRVGFETLDPRILPEMAIKVTFLDNAEPTATPAAAAPSPAASQR